MRFVAASVVCFLIPAVLCAQDKKEPRPGDVMIEKYLASECDKLSAKFLDGAKTLDEWKQKRPRLYQEYMDMLGLWPIPEKTPLKATKTGEVEAHGVIVEKIYFQSKPGLYVTANVYRPGPQASNASPRGQKLPAIVYVCGHAWKGRDGNKSAYQDHGFWFANNGYVCIILDTLQLGEIPGVHHGTYGTPWRHIKEKNKNENRFWWHAIGYSPAAVECWNGMRAIDYLCTRPDVDPDKIGVTGISGGGAATFWIAAADERVKVAVPVSGMSDLEFYVKQKGVNSHCDCMFLYNTYQWDWTTIAALVAPRPLLFANSDNDPLFPMDANRRIMAKLHKVYEMYSKPQDKRSVPGGVPAGPVDEYVSPGGHAYRPDLRIAVFKFFNKHLKGDAAARVEDSAKYTPLEGRKLRVFPEDADVPKDAINGRIDETFIPAAKVKLPEKGKFAEWKKGTLQSLMTKVFRGFDKIPAATFVEGGIGHAPLFMYRSESDVRIYSGFPIPTKNPSAVTLIVQASWPRKDAEAVEVLLAQRDLWKANLGGEIGFNVWPRGNLITPHYEWTTASPPNYVVRAHALLGQGLDAKRVWDTAALSNVMRQEFAKGKEKMELRRLGGSGREGILAAYAALFEPAIKEVVVIDPPKSHKDGPYFLNVMRVLDIPEALGLLAPTPLTIIGGNDPAFDRTAEIYRLAGAADKLKRK